MIEKVQIKGLKCFDDITMDMKPFTLLAGVNSAGKSTVLQAILAMKQNGENPFYGEYIKLGEPNELKNKYIGSRKIEIRINDEYCKVVEDKGIGVMSNSLPDAVSLKYLSAERIGVKDLYKKRISDSEEIGVKCEYVFEYLAEHEMDSWENNELVWDGNSKLTFNGQVDYWLEKILGYKVYARKIERTDYVQVTYKNKAIRSEISPMNVGTGVTFMAELLIAALSCKRGDTLMIENAEIHLHPSGQAEFMKFLCFLASKGIQIIMETHSDHIFNGLRKNISTDFIDKDDVSVFFFDKNGSGCSQPIKVGLTDDGQIADGLPDGMFDQIKKDLDVILGW